MNNARNIGPTLIALLTVAIWGLTFISTKILLQTFTPVEILFLRFLIGLIALSLFRPHILRVKARRHHLLFMAAGAFGVCLYFMLENIALQFCTAGNISVTVATAPMFTALVATLVFKKKGVLTRNFVIGFFIAMAGIVLTSFADVSTASVGFGDLLAVLAALSWAFYSNLISRLSSYGYDEISVTKRCFVWGLIFIAIAMCFFDRSGQMLVGLTMPINLLNIGFLGLCASAACFAMWGYSVNHLGVARASAFIYLNPPITIFAGIILLGEPLTLQIVIGAILVLGGLILSEYQPKPKPKPKP